MIIIQKIEDGLLKEIENYWQFVSEIYDGITLALYARDENGMYKSMYARKNESVYMTFKTEKDAVDWLTEKVQKEEGVRE